MVNIWVQIELNSDSGNRCPHPAFGLMVSEVSVLYLIVPAIIRAQLFIKMQ